MAIARGIDYAFLPHPPVDAIKSAGFHFVGRYVSSLSDNDRNGKNLLPAEKDALLASGRKIVLFAEEGAQRMLGGHSAGVADAEHFDAVVKALGMPSIAMYGGADWDAAPAEQTPINAYLDGAASVIGRKRTGIYGGYYVVKRALDAGKAHYACQTIAWSGGQWDSRAQLRQHLQINVSGVSADLDDAWAVDYGQWPRPVAPPPVPASPQVLTADGTLSLIDACTAHSTPIGRALWLMVQDHPKGLGPLQLAYLNAADLHAPMPQGMAYVVG
jgi:hypothetical protein